MSLADFQQLTNDLVRDKDGVIVNATRDSTIATAVLRYSDDRPRPVVVDLVSTGGMQLALPAGWQVDYSALLAVEYPIDRDPRAMLDMGAVSLYQSPTVVKIQLPISLGAGDIARVTYTQRHVVDVATDSVPIADRHAVCCWAASILCGQLANWYATEGEPTIQADSVDHRRKSDVFRSRERELAQRYLKDLGLDEKRSGAAGVVVNLQGANSRGGDRLFHQRRYR